MYVHIYTHTHTIIKCEVLWVLKNVYTHLNLFSHPLPEKVPECFFPAIAVLKKITILISIIIDSTCLFLKFI